MVAADIRGNGGRPTAVGWSVAAARWLALLFVLAGILSIPARAQGTKATSPVPIVGVNKFDLFMQYLGTASGGNGSVAYRGVTRAMARKALDDARDAGVGLVRVAVTGFPPAVHGARGDLDLWRAAPGEFWAQVDMMMDDLDARGMRLAAVLMWNGAQFPAMAGDTVADLIRNPESASWRMLVQFVTEFIGRYRGRKTILFYELTNELNLRADLDNVRRCDRAQREKRCDITGNFSTDDLIGFTRRFAEVIRAADPSRPISSGFSIPRGSAEHLRARPEWTPGGPDWSLDTNEQFARNLIDIHGAVDIISIHLYDNPRNQRFGSSESVDLLVAAKRAADQAGKPLFVGEFGEPKPRQAGGGSFTDRMISKLAELRVPYSAVWVWQFYLRRPYLTYDSQHTAFNLEPGYTDFLIDRIRTANMAAGAVAQKAAGADATPPRLVLTWPLPCAVLAGQQRLHAVASDDHGKVSRVEFLFAGKRMSYSVPPYEWALNADEIASGEYEVRVHAFDIAGNTASSSARVFVGQAAESKRCLADLTRGQAVR